MAFQPNPLVKSLGVTGDTTVIIPKTTMVLAITIVNNTANAITGGLRIGTTAGGIDVVVAQAVGANDKIVIADTDILKRIFSITADQTLFIEAVTAWNSANINIYFGLHNLYDY